MNALGGIAACLIWLYVGPLWAVLFVACVFVVVKLDRKKKVNEEEAQLVSEAGYRRAEELDRTAAAERAARLLRSDDDPDGAGPV